MWATVQCSAVQCSAVQCSAVQCSGPHMGGTESHQSQSTAVGASPSLTVRHRSQSRDSQSEISQSESPTAMISCWAPCLLLVLAPAGAIKFAKEGVTVP
jgi:hypothetical protein